MKKVTYSLEQLISAIELNGYEQDYGNYRTTDGSTILAACAIGQGAFNTGLTPGQFESLLLNCGVSANRVITKNDIERKPIAEIAKAMRQKYSNILNREANVILVDEVKTVTWYERYDNYQGVKVAPLHEEEYVV